MTKKCALITGASSGIGVSISKAFAREGYSLALTGLEDSGPEFARMLEREYGTKVYFEKIDLKDAQAISDFVNRSHKFLGGLSVLVSNAGIQHVAPIEEFPESKWNDILSVNLTAAFHLAKAVWPTMKSQNFGRIINVASAHGLRASEHKSAYVASKHGLIGLTKVLALEGAPHGITANALCPGFVKTPLVDRQIDTLSAAQGLDRDQVARQQILKKHAVKDFVSPDFLAETCLFLASEKASLMTGVALPVDGGWTAQ